MVGMLPCSRAPSKALWTAYHYSTSLWIEFLALVWAAMSRQLLSKSNAPGLQRVQRLLPSLAPVGPNDSDIE